MKGKLKLKYWVKAVLMIVPILVVSISILNKLDQGFVNGCMDQGYSRSYCERSR